MLSVDMRDFILTFWVGMGIGGSEAKEPVSVCLILVPPLFM